MADVTIYIDKIGSSESAATIKTKYESNANTNAFTDDEKTLLGNQSGINTGDQIIPVSGVDFDPVGTDNSDDNAVNTLYSGLEASKADKSNVLELDNIDVYTPTLDYHPSTKKYVDDNAASATVDDNVYDGTWSGDLNGISKNRLYEKIESVIAGVGTGATPETFTAVGGETNWVVTTAITSSHKFFVNGVKLVEGTDYTKTGSTFTFIGYTSVTGHEWEYFPDIAVPTTYSASETSIADAGGLITATDVEGALQENRTAINLNTSKTGVTTEISDITAEPLSDLNDVTITTVASGELLKWNGTAWINNTIAEAGLAAASHTHTASEVTDFDTEVSNNANVVANTAKVTYPSSDATKVGFISVTQAVDLDTMESNIATNNAKAGVTTQISNLSEDTTPQLGGELDFNGHSVGGDAQTATGDGTTTIDWGAGNFFHFTFGAFNEVFTFTAPTKAGTFILKLVQDSVGNRTATFPATVKWSGGTAPTLTTTATTGTDIITFYFDGTNYFAVEVLNFS